MHLGAPLVAGRTNLRLGKGAWKRRVGQPHGGCLGHWSQRPIPPEALRYLDLLRFNRQHFTWRPPRLLWLAVGFCCTG
jgi:hypothetical protein